MRERERAGDISKYVGMWESYDLGRPRMQPNDTWYVRNGRSSFPPIRSWIRIHLNNKQRGRYITVGRSGQRLLVSRKPTRASAPCQPHGGLISERQSALPSSSQTICSWARSLRVKLSIKSLQSAATLLLLHQSPVGLQLLQ